MMPASRTTALLFLPALALAAGLLAGCAPGTGTPATPDPVDSSSASTPSPDPTETDATGGGTEVDADAELRANIVDAVSSGNTAALHDLWADSVHVTYAASEDEGDVRDRALLAMNVSNATSPTAVWDFDLPASLIETYRTSGGPSYVDDFPAGVLVGRSSEDKVIAFAISGGVITRLFISNTESALV